MQQTFGIRSTPPFLFFRKKREDRNVEKRENEWKEKKSKNDKYGTLFIKKDFCKGSGSRLLEKTSLYFTKD
jgi:hypothetical protein